MQSRGVFRARFGILASIISLAAGLALVPTAHGQEIEWIRQFGSSSFDLAWGISVDASGIYVAGWTDHALPGQTSTGGRDAFVRKYDADGTEVWTRQFGTSSLDETRGISVDASGIYVAGETWGTLPGQTSAGASDAFVRKYDADGTEVWTHQFGSLSIGIDAARGISVDASGVYVAGETLGTLPGQTSAGSGDAFVRKYDADGNEVWTHQFGTSSLDETRGISVDASGVYVAGETWGTLPGQTSAGGRDAFVRKYDADGTEVWTRQFGSSSSESAFGISVDASGIYVAGWTNGTLPGQTSAGSVDAFVRKYDADGNEVWTRQFGSPITDVARGISVDASGVYVAGETLGTLPGQTSAGSADAFVRKYDADGTEVWTRQFGSSSWDQAFGISVDASSIYVAGLTWGTLPDQTSAGSSDAFVVKLSILTPAELIQQLIADVIDLNLKQGISNSLDRKLDAVVQALDDLNQNNDVAAINALQAFINSVEAQRGIHITEAEADALIAAAQQIITLLGG
jgi:hypothetical protein